MASKALRRPDQFTNSKLAPYQHDKLMALLYRRTLPEQLGEAVYHLERGASESVAALTAGLSKLEWRYVLYLGDSGHPAYAEFARLVRMARGGAQAALQARIYERDDLGAQQYSLKMMGCEEALEADRPAQPVGQSTVNVVFRQFGEVVDADDVEVVDG